MQWDLDSPKKILKTLVAFSNTAGGRIIIGVEDKTHKPIGIDNPLDEEERLCSLIADSIAPRLVPNIEMTTVDGNFPSPYITELGHRTRFVFPLIAPVTVSAGAQSRAQSGAQSGAQSRAQSNLVLMALSDCPLSSSEIAVILDLDSKTGALKRAIEELLEKSLIEYTIPEKPKSRLQKYKLTDLGAQSGVELTAPVTAPVNMYVRRLLELLISNGPQSNADILDAFELKSRRRLRETYIQSAMTENLIEYTIPEKPKSRLQKYRITQKGRQAIDFEFSGQGEG